MASLYRVGTRYKDSGDSNVVYRNGMMEVHGGCYHFVKDLEGARKLAEFLTKIRFRYNRVFVVAKCTIPAGTMVSEGMFRTNNGTVVVDSICAKSFGAGFCPALLISAHQSVITAPSNPQSSRRT